MALVGLTIYNPFNPSTHLWKLWLCLQQGLPASEKFTTEGLADKSSACLGMAGQRKLKVFLYLFKSAQTWIGFINFEKQHHVQLKGLRQFELRSTFISYFSSTIDIFHSCSSPLGFFRFLKACHRPPVEEAHVVAGCPQLSPLVILVAVVEHPKCRTIHLSRSEETRETK